MTGSLDQLTAGQAIPYGGDRVAVVPDELARAFRAGDRLLVVQESGDLLHVPASAQAVASTAVTRAAVAFERMGAVSDEQISRFFEAFAARLESEDAWAPIAAANAEDVAGAAARGRSTTRLVAGEAMRRDMIAGLRLWRDAGASRGRVLERIEHEGWSAEQVVAPLGVVGFVFEGRPNVFADASADADRFAAAVFHSLDRKVCNTLNVCCIPRARAGELVPRFLDALWRAGERRGHGCRLHLAGGGDGHLPGAWRDARVRVRRAEGDRDEPLVEPLSDDQLGREWEWEDTPEVTLKLVDDIAEAVALFNRHSPRLVAVIIAEDAAAKARFFEAVDAPFVGDGFTRWVDGQYALNRPELGLSNWENGRLFARGAVLAGDGVYTIRTRMIQLDPGLDRQGGRFDGSGGAALRGPAPSRSLAS